MDSLNVSKCIHCKCCTKNCSFLNQYHLDLEGFSKRRDLTYHCFLCGRCASICPKNIDGKKIALYLRTDIVKENGGKIADKVYRGLLWEKNPYKFANYKKGKKKSVLFSGCSFPSFYPRTMKHLTKLLEQRNIGVVYECCGKPIEELGLQKDVRNTIDKMNEKFSRLGIEEAIMLCPNCYHFLKGRLQVEMASIYDKLHKLELGKGIHKEKIPMYYPCPDRAKKEMMEGIRKYLKGEEVDAFPGTQCCGLGGCAAARERKLSAEMACSVKDAKTNELYTYCASCVGNYRRAGYAGAYHILPIILEIDEKVPLGIQPILNRALLKLRR